MATELERRGADLADPLWSAKYLIEQPDMIRAVHRDYFAAGADVATTATYQATFEAFHRRGMKPPAAAQLMRDAVTLAGTARDEFWAEYAGRTDQPANRGGRLRPLVAASIGPYGALLADGSEYRGRYTVSDRELRDFHRPRLAVLAASGADLLAFETLPCLREALVLARLLEEFPALCAWCSFSCLDGTRNCEGEYIDACAAALQPFGRIVAVGVNCSHPDHVESLLRRMGNHTDKPLLAYPNSGEHFEPKAKIWLSGSDTRSFTDRVDSWYQAGARLIGGCCRTTPRDIEALYRQRLALPGHAQCSEKFGSRFSKNARTPSTQS